MRVPDVYHPPPEGSEAYVRPQKEETQDYAEILQKGLEEAISRSDYPTVIPLFSSYTDGPGQFTINSLLGILGSTERGRKFLNADSSSRYDAVRAFIYKQTGRVIDEKLDSKLDMPFKNIDGWRIIITPHQTTALNTVRLEKAPKDK